MPFADGQLSTSSPFRPTGRAFDIFLGFYPKLERKDTRNEEHFSQPIFLGLPKNPKLSGYLGSGKLYHQSCHIRLTNKIDDRMPQVTVLQLNRFKALSVKRTTCNMNSGPSKIDFSRCCKMTITFGLAQPSL